jgi:phage repressor protein C with HTH and peptisase S24 domain
MSSKKLSERIRLARGGLNKAEFAKSLAVSPSYITELESGAKQNISTMLAELISIKYNIDKTWLLTGEGERGIYETPGLAEKAVSVAEDISIDWEVLEKEQVVPREEPEELRTVNVYSWDVVRDPKNKSFRIPIESIFMSVERAELGPVALKVEGDAMAPNIKDGAIVGLNYKDRAFVDGQIYIVRVPGGDVVLRRLFRGLNKIILRSDNQVFPEMELAPGVFQEARVMVGRVVWVLQNL